jgi:hypothetical protein
MTPVPRAVNSVCEATVRTIGTYNESAEPLSETIG